MGEGCGAAALTRNPEDAIVPLGFGVHESGHMRQDLDAFHEEILIVYEENIGPE